MSQDYQPRYRDRDYHDRGRDPDNYNNRYRSRQGYSSRSPPKAELQYDDNDDDHGEDGEVSEGDDHDNSRQRSHSRRRDPYSGNYSQGQHDQYDQNDGVYGRRDRSKQYRQSNRRDWDARPHLHSSSRSPNSYEGRYRSGSPLSFAGPPSDTVIFEGLPSSLPAGELRSCLMASTDLSRFSVVEIRLPTLSRGRRCAFVQFQTTDDAIEFMKTKGPSISIKISSDEREGSESDYDIHVVFARPREENASRSQPTVGPDWTCEHCDFENYATRHKCKNCGEPQIIYEAPPATRPVLTGESDASNTPSQILVVYPLHSSIDESIFANEMQLLEKEEKPEAARDILGGHKLKSTAPTGNTAGYGARPKSLHRVFLMRDRYTDDPIKFGFAEFWTMEDAHAALIKFHKSRAYTVAGLPATVSTIHHGVFVPEADRVPISMEKFSFHPIINPSIRVRYWEPTVYPSERIVTDEPPTSDKKKKSGETSDTLAEAAKSKKRKAEGTATPSSKKPTGMLGQMALWQKKHAEIREPSCSGQSQQQAPIKISLSGVSAEPQPETNPTSSVSLNEANSNNDSLPAVSISYVDRDNVSCLICMMKYKSIDDLNTHERSRNHKNAMADEGKVQAAKPRLLKRDKRLQQKTSDQDSAQGAEDTTNQYRDRAKERREAFKQPNRPVNASAPIDSANPAGKSSSSATAATSTTIGSAAASSSATTGAAAATTPAAAPKSKGSAMLAKMGWTAGQGLGANGEGRTETIATNAYQEGVGLGAEGGNLGDAAAVAERKTRGGHTDYLNMVQDRARERYEKMG